MRHILLFVALASFSSAGIAACSSSSSGTGGTGGGSDGGGTHDATSGQGDGSGGADGAGHFGDGSSTSEGSAGDAGGGDDGSATTDGGSGSETGTGHDGGSSDGASGDGSSPTEAGSDGASDGGITDAASTPECGATPTLHPDEAGTIFCGFDGVSDLLCPTGQECCLGGYLGDAGFAPQACAAQGAACPNEGTSDAGAGAIPIACMQISDCTANGVVNATGCCLQGATAPAPVAGCGYDKATLGTAVVCESAAGASGPAACANGEVQLCSSAADCPTGTTCTPGKWKIFQVGFCL